MNSALLIKPYFKENRYRIALGLFCLIAVDFLQLFIPRVIKWAVDDLTAFRVGLAGLLVYALYIMGIAVVIALLRYVWRHCLMGLSRRVEEGLRNRFFEHIQTLSASYFHRMKTGDLMAHATNDITNVRMATGMGLVALTDAVVLGTAAIGFMAYININLTLFVLIPMPFIIVGARFFSRRMHLRYQKVQAAFAALTEVVRERFAGIRIIKAYNREKQEIAKLATVSKDYIRQNLKLVKITGLFFPIMLFLSNLGLAMVLFLGGRQTITATITPGDFVAFISYLGLLTWPMMAMGWVINLIQRGKASLDRINEILQASPDIADMPGAIPVQRVLGEVVFKNVEFSYNSGNPKNGDMVVLKGIDIKIDPGKILGIVGPPGSGKTTVLSLIPRLFDASKGSVLIDGIDIRNMRVQDLRSQISYVPQEPFLFSGTIRDNITFGNTKTHEPELTKALKDASLHETIKSFSNGLDTIVGEKGVILSGGQKQRIAIARALLKEKAILILDDPVSQVDMETGNDIINTFRSMNGSRTIIIVSHRLSAIRFSDHIVVLANGRVAESGTHENLMKNNAYYAKTFRLQEIEEELHAL